MGSGSRLHRLTAGNRRPGNCIPVLSLSPSLLRASTRGAPAAIFLRFIVDFYDNLPNLTPPCASSGLARDVSPGHRPTPQPTSAAAGGLPLHPMAPELKLILSVA